MIKNLYFAFCEKKAAEGTLTIINSSFVRVVGSPAARAVVKTVSFILSSRGSENARQGDGKMHLARKKKEATTRTRLKRLVERRISFL